jgi:hypothetical protein
MSSLLWMSVAIVFGIILLLSFFWTLSIDSFLKKSLKSYKNHDILRFANIF